MAALYYIKCKLDTFIACKSTHFLSSNIHLKELK